MGKITKRSVVHLPYTNNTGAHLGEWFKLLTEETSQVSLIVINPSTFDGWYIHGDRSEWHVCIKGNVLIGLVGQGTEPTGEQHLQAVHVPNLVGHGIYNASDDPAWVLVMSDLPHRLNEDEYPLPIAAGELETLETLWEHYYGNDEDDTTEQEEGIEDE